MKRYISKISLVLGLILIALSSACTKVPIGYLHTSDAVYSPNIKLAYRQVDTDRLTDSEKEAKLNSAYSSTQLQGLGGTQPISYTFHSVKVSDGGDQAAFLKVVGEGSLIVRGGYIQLLQKGASQLPAGKYTVSIRISNEGHEAILNDAFTFWVKEQYEVGDEDLVNTSEN